VNVEQLVAPVQSDVFDEEPGHSLALARRCIGVVPQSGKVGGQSEHTLALLLVQQRVRLTLTLVVVLCRVQGAQLVVPLGFHL